MMFLGLMKIAFPFFSVLSAYTRIFCMKNVTGIIVSCFLDNVVSIHETNAFDIKFAVPRSEIVMIS